MGRKPLWEDASLGLETAQDILDYQRAVKEAWKNLPETKEKIFSYNRKKTLNRCLKRASVPTVNTIKKYNFTKEELEPIFQATLEKTMLIAYSNQGSVESTDTEESD